MEAVTEKFEFLDFEPDSKTQGHTSRIVSELVNAAPSDASLRAYLAKTRAGFEASFKLCSMAGTFAAKAAAQTPAEALNMMTERIRTQLDAWRKAKTKLLSKSFLG